MRPWPRIGDLLTDRERRLFEEHLLGDLGEALRARLQEAEELVAATNRILATVSTSQGIRVRLDWAVRDDAGNGAAEAVRLLRRMSQLNNSERERLRELMHDIIETAKADAPELSYTEHLGTALDYRSWHGFTVRINRPEWAGAWRPLTRTTGLSQGEQKVVCYLPLFAAAGAHFTAVAGAHAPYAPRFILLDDAFPKIDVHTHPLLFGLLVDLDLDFVITSERLWGDTPRLPSLGDLRNAASAWRDRHRPVRVPVGRSSPDDRGPVTSTGDRTAPRWAYSAELEPLWRGAFRALERSGRKLPRTVAVTGLSEGGRREVGALVGQVLLDPNVRLDVDSLQEVLLARCGLGLLDMVEAVLGAVPGSGAARRRGVRGPIRPAAGRAGLVAR